MIRGVTLTLMVGPGVAAPVPRAVIESLKSVRVTTSAGHRSPSGFQLVFEMTKGSPLETVFLLASGSLPPVMRTILVATVNGTSHVLIDGVITRQETSPASSGGATTLTVTGTDLTTVMDQIDFSGIPMPAMPPFARVALMLAKYAVFGVIPKVIPSVLVDVPIPTSRIPSQRGTDLAYINALADEVGYVFYHEPGASPGTSFAYWGPEIKVGTPQPALNVDMDAHTNVESLSFQFNADGTTLPIVYIHEELTKVPIPIPIPPITPLNPPLGAVPPLPLNITPIHQTAKYGPVRAALVGLAKAARSNDAVTANGSLDVLRYGNILQARKLVGVRGAGTAFDGLYYVQSVVHELSRDGYRQSFTLSRNGLVSTVSKVPA